MKSGLFLFALALVAASAQDQRALAGFTRSPTEHVINEVEQPFEVRSVTGVVTREGSEPLQPLEDVLVEIKGPGDHDKIRATKTDVNGKFHIGHVPAGTYRFKTTLNGFQSAVGTIIVSRKAPKKNSIGLAVLIGT